MLVYDRGNPRYDDSRTIKIVVQDRDDNPPQFSRSLYPPPYQVSLLEENINYNVANLDIASDPDFGNNSRICYYIVGQYQNIETIL